MDGNNSIYFMANYDPFKSDFILVWSIKSQLKGNWKTVTRKPCAYSAIYWKPWSLRGHLAHMKWRTKQTVGSHMVFTVAWLFMVFYLNLSLLNFIATSWGSSCCRQKNPGHYYFKTHQRQQPHLYNETLKKNKLSSRNRKEKQGTRIINVFEISKNR